MVTTALFVLYKICLSQCICGKKAMICLVGLPTILTTRVKAGFFLSTLTSLTCGGQRKRDITQSHYIFLSLICGINSNAKFRRFGFFNCRFY